MDTRPSALVPDRDAHAAAEPRRGPEASRLGLHALAPHAATLRPIGGFYLLILGLSFLLLPQGPVGIWLQPIWLPGGLLVLSGLASLWLAVAQLPRGATIAVATLSALAPLGIAAVYLILGIYPGTATLGLLAVGLLLSPFLPQATDQKVWRPDALGLAFGGSVLVQGLDLLIRPDMPTSVAAILNLPALPLSLLMIGGGGGVVLTQLVLATPAWLRWLAHLVCGLTLIGLQTLVTLVIDPLYWVLGSAANLRGLAVLLLPWLSLRAGRVDRSAFRLRVALALLTAAVVPMAIALPVVIATIEGPEAELRTAQQVAFGAAMLVMLGASVGGWWLAGGLTRSLTWLMHSVNRVAEGQPAASLPQQGAMEVVALSQAVTQMAHSLQARADERAALLEREQQARAAAEAATARTERLQRLTAALGAALSPAEVAQIILHQGLPAVGASAGAIALRSNDGASLEMLQVLGYPEELIAPWQHVPLSSATPFAEVVRTGQPVLLESRAEGVLRYPALAAGEAVFGNGAIAAFPLVVRDEVIGGLGFSFAQPRVFSEEELAFATSLVQQCAQALERARLYAAEQRARAEAQEAVRVRDAFLSVAAHELRTPLTALLGNAQLAARRAAQGEIAAERQQRALSSVVEQAARLNRMIAALLDVSQLETGQLQVALAPMDMVALLRSVRAESEPTLQAHRLICELPAEPLLIAGDELRLRQVLENLIGNAVKYSPRGGSVTVWAERREAQVCVSVRDEGIGIPADAIPRLFQRFFRVGNGEARRISGIGVGLYVVREIVALHGGTVEVQSSEGQGSTFTIALPALRELERPL